MVDDGSMYLCRLTDQSDSSIDLERQKKFPHSRTKEEDMLLNRISARRFFSTIILTLFCLPAEATSPSKWTTIGNFTAVAGRRAELPCINSGLVGYKVAWIRSKSKTLLTIDSQTVANDDRLRVRASSDLSTWTLVIDPVQFDDRGAYMCQINTKPMTNQIAHLEIVVPPDIVSEETSVDSTVREDERLEWTCVARGYPRPTIVWRREPGDGVQVQSEAGLSEALVTDLNYISDAVNNRPVQVQTARSSIILPAVRRHQAGPYMCIASNNVGAPVSKRLRLDVDVRPAIKASQSLVYAKLGQNATLACEYIASTSHMVKTRWRRFDNTTRSLTAISRQKASPMYTYVDITSATDFDQLGPVRRMNMILSLIDLKDEDFANYSCSAYNLWGSVSAAVQLVQSKVSQVFVEGNSSNITTEMNLSANKKILRRSDGLEKRRRDGDRSRTSLYNHSRQDQGQKHRDKGGIRPKWMTSSSSSPHQHQHLIISLLIIFCCLSSSLQPIDNNNN